MAARPNALRTLEYGKRLVEHQVKRLEDMIFMTDNVLQDNKTLTAEDVVGYKSCISAAKKQLTLLNKVSDIPDPVVPESSLTPRKRGRPSKAELEELALSRGEAPETAPKPRGRKPKTAAVEAVVSMIEQVNAPKPRGRKPKAPITAEAIASAHAVLNAPKKRGRKSRETLAAEEAAKAVLQAAEPKKRGRPPKAKSVETVEVSAAPRPARAPKPAAPVVNVASVTEEQPVKRGPGRPKGSKNKVHAMNGQNGEIVAVA